MIRLLEDLVTDVVEEDSAVNIQGLSIEETVQNVTEIRHDNIQEITNDEGHVTAQESLFENVADLTISRKDILDIVQNYASIDEGVAGVFENYNIQDENVSDYDKNYLKHSVNQSMKCIELLKQDNSNEEIEKYMKAPFPLPKKLKELLLPQKDSIENLVLQSGDYSITVSDDRHDVIKSLKDLNVKFDASQGKQNLKIKLSNHLKKNHPIHKHVEKLSLASARQLLNALTNSVKRRSLRDTKRAIISECFKNAASGPLTDLCKLESKILCSTKNTEVQGPAVVREIREIPTLMPMVSVWSDQVEQSIVKTEPGNDPISVHKGSIESIEEDPLACADQQRVKQEPLDDEPEAKKVKSV